MKYVLNHEGEPMPELDIFQWAKAFEEMDRRVALDMVGDVKISTIFLGIDHGNDPNNPLLWETMIFGGPLDKEYKRCGGNRSDAMKMHEGQVARVKGGCE